MRLLIRTLITVGLLIILRIAAAILDKTSAYSISFHQNFIKSLQYLVLCWFIIAVILGLFFKSEPSKANLGAVVILLFLTFGTEMICSYWLKHPARIPGFLKYAYQDYYEQYQRKVIQVESSCSEFDSGFFYRLRPNSGCIFSNIEFSTPASANSGGLRDYESSLINPDIICIGDSYTMGWGVNQGDTYSSLIQKNTGLKVLNAGVSSFGTVRELRKLYSLDTSNVKWVILQYSDNDIEETKPFVKNGFQLKTSSAQAYDSIVKIYKWSRVYYPGKILLTTANFKLKSLIKNLFSHKNKDVVQVGNITASINESIDLFAQTLYHFNLPMNKIKLIIVYANDMDVPNRLFTNGLTNLIKKSPYREYFNNNCFILNTSDFLNKSDMFILDKHYNARGYKKIADQISNIIVHNSALGSLP